MTGQHQPEARRIPAPSVESSTMATSAAATQAPASTPAPSPAAKFTVNIGVPELGHRRIYLPGAEQSNTGHTVIPVSPVYSVRVPNVLIDSDYRHGPPMEYVTHADLERICRLNPPRPAPIPSVKNTAPQANQNGHAPKRRQAPATGVVAEAAPSAGITAISATEATTASRVTQLPTHAGVVADPAPSAVTVSTSASVEPTEATTEATTASRVTQLPTSRAVATHKRAHYWRRAPATLSRRSVAGRSNMHTASTERR